MIPLVALLACGPQPPPSFPTPAPDRFTWHDPETSWNRQRVVALVGGRWRTPVSLEDPPPHHQLAYRKDGIWLASASIDPHVLPKDSPRAELAAVLDSYNQAQLAHPEGAHYQLGVEQEGTHLIAVPTSVWSGSAWTPTRPIFDEVVELDQGQQTGRCGDLLAQVARSALGRHGAILSGPAGIFGPWGLPSVWSQQQCNLQPSATARAHVVDILHQLEAFSHGEPFYYTLTIANLRPGSTECDLAKPTRECPAYRFLVHNVSKAEHGFEKLRDRLVAQGYPRLDYARPRPPAWHAPDRAPTPE